MTATLCVITVATLQELGHLKSFWATTIVSAAVIDDVIGIRGAHLRAGCLQRHR